MSSLTEAPAGLVLPGLAGGIGLDNFRELARCVQDAGVDAIELSGGMWDCLARKEAEIGFRPVPAPESRTRLKSPDKQSYYIKFAESLEARLPVVLVGGNRDVERLEAIARQGKVGFFALCRPLICEPDLPKRWREGRGASGAECIPCNSCIYDMYIRLDRGEPGIATCLVKRKPEEVGVAQRWLSSWVRDNLIT
jgi:2,4-dienoyl-CoA reductase-like NADH-dependent reductase (Old Yellow Enzyme family)